MSQSQLEQHMRSTRLQGNPTGVSRIPSTSSLRPSSSRLPLIKPSSSRWALNSNVSATPSSGIPLPKSHIPSIRSTTSLRQPPSSNHLRPSRLQPINSGTVTNNAEGNGLKSGPRTIKRVPSTNFKENFFAPPPPVPVRLEHLVNRDVPPGHAVAVVTKKKSGILLQRNGVGLGNGRRQVPEVFINGAKNEVVRSYRESLNASDDRMPNVKRGPGEGSSAPVSGAVKRVVPTSPAFCGSTITHCTPRKIITTVSSSQLRPKPLSDRLISSPWRGPRISVDQIKDTEISFSADDSMDLTSFQTSSVLRTDHPLAQPETNLKSDWLSISSLSRPRSRAESTGPETPPLTTKPDHQLVTALEAKDKQIELLQMELSLERQMLGRIGREAEDEAEVVRLRHEHQMEEVVGSIERMRVESVIAKYREAERSAAELQSDIEANRGLIKRLKDIS